MASIANSPLGAPVLMVEALSVAFRGREGRALTVVDQVSFQVRKGEIFGLLGESGSGKSTLCHALVRALPPAATIESGTVWLRDINILQLSARALAGIRGARIGFIPQDAMSALNPVRSNGSQLRETLKNLPKGERTSHSVRLLKDLSVPRPERIMATYPHELSGGLRQRVVATIGRILDPEVIIADEPTTALDVVNQAQLLRRLRMLRDRDGTSIVVVSHDMGVIAEVCDTVGVMYAGKLVELGPVEQIFDNPAHPYTRGLLRCLPTLDVRTARLYAIPGHPPTPEEFSTGCPFAPRCSEAMPHCREKFPETKRLSPDHTVACWAVGP